MDNVARLSASEKRALVDSWPAPPYQTNPLPGVHLALIGKGLATSDGLNLKGQAVRQHLLQEQNNG